MLIYNSENECYSRFIPIDQAAEMQDKIKKLETRLQNMPVSYRFNQYLHFTSLCFIRIFIKIKNILI